MKDDTISRQAAIDELGLYAEMLMRVLDDLDVVGNEREKYAWGLGVIEECIKDMKELPSVQPEPKFGHWVDDHCSECGYGVLPWNNTPFCPHCGAYMGDKK